MSTAETSLISLRLIKLKERGLEHCKYMHLSVHIYLHGYTYTRANVYTCMKRNIPIHV